LFTTDRMLGLLNLMGSSRIDYEGMFVKTIFSTAN